MLMIIAKIVPKGPQILVRGSFGPQYKVFTVSDPAKLEEQLNTIFADKELEFEQVVTA
jgi:hypothetical protein